MPTRLIREGILSSARVNALSLGAEVFYRRLMSVADDYGRYYASPGTLRGACWPTSPDKVKDSQVFEWLGECCNGEDPLIVTYYVKGCSYLQIQGFNQQTRSKSKFPEYVINLQADASQVLSKCLAGDIQVISNCLASDEQLLSTSRSRNSETKSNTDAKAEAVASPKRGSGEAHGSRFTLTEIPSEYLSYGVEKMGWPEERTVDVFEGFRLHFAAQSGQKARMANWLAAWQGWCRRERKHAPNLFENRPVKKTFLESVESGMRQRMEVGLPPL